MQEEFSQTSLDAYAYPQRVTPCDLDSDFRARVKGGVGLGEALVFEGKGGVIKLELVVLGGVVVRVKKVARSSAPAWSYLLPNVLRS